MNDANDSHEENELEDYGDEGIKTFNAKIPKFLILTYFILPIWGIVTFCIFWNGSVGWFDRGAWQQLQIAANTTFPEVNHDLDQQEQSAALPEMDIHGQ